LVELDENGISVKALKNGLYIIHGIIGEEKI
jgi:hypothetical protein